jgi:hypothetical protein
VVSLGLCFGGALLALDAGYSVALEAFIAGSLVAESGEGKRVEHLVVGVRDMFGAAFFVSVGMMIDPRLVAEHWVAVVVLSAVVVAGTLLAVSVGAFLSGSDVRTSTQAGMSLTQIGEFAFIIAAVGTTAGVVGDFLYPVAVAVSAVTTLTTPIAIRASGAFAAFVDRRLPRPMQTFVGLYGTWIASLRTTPDSAGTAPLVRRTIRLLVLDTALLAAVVIGTVFARPHLRPRPPRRPATCLPCTGCCPAWATPCRASCVREMPRRAGRWATCRCARRRARWCWPSPAATTTCCCRWGRSGWRWVTCSRWLAPPKRSPTRCACCAARPWPRPTPWVPWTRSPRRDSWHGSAVAAPGAPETQGAPVG